MKSIRLLFFVLISSLVLSACGQKGPLIVEEPDVQAAKDKSIVSEDAIHEVNENSEEDESNEQ